MAIALYTLGKSSIAVFLILFFSSMPIGALVAIFLLNKWKYWAFKNVRNVHELKKRAIEVKLITEKDKFFEKIENSTEYDVKHWEIKQKFLQNDIFLDDLSIPKETYIYHSRALICFFLIIALLLIAGCIYVLTDNLLLVGVSASIVIVSFVYINKKRWKREEPLILIDDKGIKVASTGFTKWKDITNDSVITVEAGKNTKFYLVYDTPERQESVCLTGTTIGRTKMSKLLLLYRNRNVLFPH